MQLRHVHCGPPCPLFLQENVLAESSMMVPETRQRLEAALTDLQTYVVRPAAAETHFHAVSQASTGWQLLLLDDPTCDMQGATLTACFAHTYSPPLTAAAHVLLTLHMLTLYMQEGNAQDAADTDELKAAQEALESVQGLLA